MASGSLYSSDNAVFASYCFYAALLALKMLIMAFLTARQRMRKSVFANPEDAASRKGSKIKFDDPDVERVRRAHLNDLENIVPFFVLGLLYVGTNPELSWAVLLFRFFAASRFVHTFVYAVYVLPQPSRALAFGLAMLVNVYLGIAVVANYAGSW